MQCSHQKIQLEFVARGSTSFEGLLSMKYLKVLISGLQAMVVERPQSRKSRPLLPQGPAVHIERDAGVRMS